MTCTPVRAEGHPNEVYWEIPDLVASAARTTNGNGTAEDLPASASQLRFQLEVTAASGGTPNLAVVLEDTIDGTNWNQVVAFTAATTTTREAKDVTGVFARKIRARWTITGSTPSFTFSVKGIAKRGGF